MADRVRLFVVDETSGQGIAGVPIALTAQLENGRSVALIVLESDPVGYVSAPYQPPKGAKLVLHPVGDPGRMNSRNYA